MQLQTIILSLAVAAVSLSSVSSVPYPANDADSNTVTLLEWNLLADGLGYDGFLNTDGRETESDESGVEHQVIEDIDGIQHRITAVISEFKVAKNRLQMAKGDSETKDAKSALKALKEKYNTQAEKERVDATLKWDNRFPKMEALIRAADPDIMTFQEMDHMKQFQDTFKETYDCSIKGVEGDNEVPYSPFNEGDLTQKLEGSKYLQELAKKRYAFGPDTPGWTRGFRMEREGMFHPNVFTIRR
jgi:hypothetical protein